MKIQVTRRHILEGVPGELSKCPIAFALTESLNIDKATVGSMAWEYTRRKCTVILWQGRDAESVCLPDFCFEFMARFDNGKEVEPFEIEVDIPEKFMKTNNERGHKRTADAEELALATIS